MKSRKLQDKIFSLEKVLLEARLKDPLSHGEIDNRKIKNIKRMIQKLRAGNDLEFTIEDLRNFYKPKKADENNMGYDDGEVVGEKVSGYDDGELVGESIEETKKEEIKDGRE